MPDDLFIHTTTMQNLDYMMRKLNDVEKKLRHMNVRGRNIVERRGVMNSLEDIKGAIVLEQYRIYHPEYINIPSEKE